jgi:hypothetical protein
LQRIDTLEQRLEQAGIFPQDCDDCGARCVGKDVDGLDSDELNSLEEKEAA